MNKIIVAQQAKTTSLLPFSQGLLRRKCACGNHTVAGGECAACAKNKIGLQRKLAIGASNDPLEQEADRVADQVMAAAVHSAVSNALPRIQCYAGQATEETDTAPASVDRVLAGSGRPLDPTLRQDMEQRFGNDFSQVRMHSGAAAEQSARDVNANAYTVGHNIVFGAGQFAPGTHGGRRLIAHELTHVVQQSGAQRIRLGRSDGKGEQSLSPPMAQSRSAEDLFGLHAGSGMGKHVQRFAFVNEKQVEKSKTDFTPEMKKMVTDALVRNYTGLDEFEKHASKQTDYLGNLADSTWMRFSPTGINLLGENHTHVTLEQVIPAVGSKSFIYEPISSDKMKASSKLKESYEVENQERFKRFGIEKEKDKQPFGAESLFAKMGYGLTLAIPYFEGKQPMSDLGKGNYVGQPIQRYLKIAWGHSKDNKLEVEQKLKAKEFVQPKMAALAAVHSSVEGKLDKFITALVVDGFIGDVLVKKENASLLSPLAEFANAFTEAMVRRAASDPSSRLSTGKRLSLTGSSKTSEKDKMKLFTEWRDFNFEDNVKAATKRGVRYAGMGQAHLDHLVAIGLEKNQHPFEMDGKDITAFKTLTDKLKKAVKNP